MREMHESPCVSSVYFNKNVFGVKQTRHAEQFLKMTMIFIPLIELLQTVP